ncbi:hypothetical protein VTO42DRAFT_5308 [Malbranchea cinnamomea]
MAPINTGPSGSFPQLEPQEVALLELASSSSTPELSLSDKEARILELYDQIHEQRLEEALLMQDPTEIPVEEDVHEQLVKAERELLEARATYSVQKKAVEAMLMTEPTIQSVHSAVKMPIERSLLPLVNQRDLLSLIYENLAQAHSACLEKLSNAEIENMKMNEGNKELVQSLLELSQPQEKTGKELITDAELKANVEALEAENRQRKANWVIMKRIVSATIVASGVDWASDERLRELVVDDSIDDL